MTRAAAPHASEHGYALVAAVAAIALFAAVALALATATRIEITKGAAEVAQARASVGADAGAALALHGLVSGDDPTLALLDGGTRQLTMGDAQITIRISDERGKVPLANIEEPAVERMLRQAGLEGASLAIARDSLLDWIDSDDEAHPDGAEAADYAPQGIAPRNAPLLSIDELARVRGFSPALVAQLRPFVTSDPDAIPFDPAHAQPQAIAVMTEAGEDGPQAIARQREADGQRVALAFTDAKALIGRPLLIAVDAVSPGGGHVHREAQIELIGASRPPYVIHSYR